MAAISPKQTSVPNASSAPPLRELRAVIAKPRLLFAIRLVCSVCLALYITYWLELQNSFWAATTAAIVCQPNLGASLQKGRYRVVGTVIGALVMVGLLAAFAQQRNVLIFSLALWCGVCGCAAVVLRNYASYAAALSGITAAIVFADSVADPNGAFLLAVIRVGEICIGIGSASAVMLIIRADTAAGQLSQTLEQVTKDLWSGFVATIATTPPTDGVSRRHGIVRDFSKLRAQIDAVIGESSYMRSRKGNLDAMLLQLLVAVSAWRDIEHLPRTTRSWPEPDHSMILSALRTLNPSDLLRDPASFKRICLEGIHRISAAERSDPVACLVNSAALELAKSLEAIADCQEILVGKGATPRRKQLFAPVITDPLPMMLAGARVFLAVLITSVFWIQTAWSIGYLSVIFSAIATLVFAAMGDQALQRAKEYSAGAAAMMVIGAFLYFSVLPGLDGFPQLLAVLVFFYGVVGYFQAGQSRPTTYLAISICSLPMLGLANPTIYNATNFLNGASTIVIGSIAGTCFFILIPALTSADVERRLKQRSLDDVRRFLVTGSADDSRRCLVALSARLCALPTTAGDDTFRLMMSLSSSVSSATFLIHDLAAKPGVTALKQVFRDFAAGDIQRGKLGLEQLSNLVSGSDYPASTDEKTRVNAHLLVFTEAITQCAQPDVPFQPQKLASEGKSYV